MWSPIMGSGCTTTESSLERPVVSSTPPCHCPKAGESKWKDLVPQSYLGPLLCQMHTQPPCLNLEDGISDFFLLPYTPV